MLLFSICLSLFWDLSAGILCVCLNALGMIDPHEFFLGPFPGKHGRHWRIR